MKENTITCYMCDAPATSKEHVPPKCLFPERKDLPKGVDLRKNLFKVPSCDAHNSHKSHDDEFFLYILSGSFQINEVGRKHYLSKVRRSIKRNSSILGNIASTASPEKIADPISEKIEDSISYELTPQRFDNMIDNLGRAIYYHHFKDKWLSSIKYHAEFLFATRDQSDIANLKRKEFTKNADKWFSHALFYGENPDVFKYQVIEDTKSIIMRLHFYEGCKLLLFFNSQHCAVVDSQGGAAVTG